MWFNSCPTRFRLLKLSYLLDLFAIKHSKSVIPDNVDFDHILNGYYDATKHGDFEICKFNFYYVLIFNYFLGDRYLILGISRTSPSNKAILLGMDGENDVICFIMPISLITNMYSCPVAFSGDV